MSGYGKIRINKKVNLVHRLSYEEYVGDIPEGMFVCHTCDNPPCFNPDHLFVGTPDDNMKDMVSKGRQALGEKNGSVKWLNRRPRGETHWAFLNKELYPRGEDIPWHKLTEEDVRFIRANPQIGSSELARKYGVAVPTIVRARVGATWRHVK